MIPRYTMSFDGVDDFIEVNDSASLDITDKITLIAWMVWHERITRDVFVVDKRYWGSVSNNSGYRLGQIYYLASDIVHIQFDIYNNTVRRVETTYEPEMFKQYFIAGVSDGSTMELYVNDVLEDTASASSIGLNSKPLKIGYRFNGLISQVLIYNRALSQAEIKWNYQNPDIPIQDGLVLWLDARCVDEVAGKWWDLSGYDNHGTIYGATRQRLVDEEVVII